MGSPGTILADSPLAEGVTLRSPLITNDPNGDAAWSADGANPQYQWLKDGNPIQNAIGQSYNVPVDSISSSADSAEFSVEITYSDADGFRNNSNPVRTDPVVVNKADNGDSVFQLQIAGEPIANSVPVGSLINASQVTSDIDGNLLTGTSDSYKWQTSSTSLVLGPQ